MTSSIMARQLWFIRLACLLLLAHCTQDGGDHFEEAFELLPLPVSVGSKLLLVETSAPAGLLIDASAPDNAPTRVSLRPNPIWVEPRNAHADQALVLTLGERGNENRKQAPGGLSIISANGELQTLDLGNSGFDRLHQSQNGHHALLTRSGSGDQLLQNINEVALIDLQRPDAPPSIQVLPETPRYVVFSEDFSLDGVPQELAAVLTSNMVAIFDLTQPDLEPLLVQLNTQTDVSLLPVQALFDPQANAYSCEPRLATTSSHCIWSPLPPRRRKRPEPATISASPSTSSQLATVQAIWRPSSSTTNSSSWWSLQKTRPLYSWT